MERIRFWSSGSYYIKRWKKEGSEEKRKGYLSHKYCNGITYESEREPLERHTHTTYNTFVALMTWHCNVDIYGI